MTFTRAWRRTSGGPAANFLAGWKTSAIVVSIDLSMVSAGGPLLAVWARTERRQPGHGAQPPAAGAPIDRVGRPLTANALLATVGEEDIADALKEGYDRADPRGLAGLRLRKSAATSRCTTASTASPATSGSPTPARTRPSATCAWPPSCRRPALDRQPAHDLRRVPGGRARRLRLPNTDCGGRAPNVDVNGAFRSMLIRGAPDTSDDGVDHDDRMHSSVDFPFLAAP